MSAVAGLDVSLTATGVCRPDGTLHTVHSTPNGNTLEEKLDRLNRTCTGIIAGLISADLVVIEGPALGVGRQAGTWDRAGLWWAVASTVNGWHVPLLEVPPGTLKKYATGKGAATKADMRMALYQRIGLDVRDDNQVDAAWLRAVGLDLLGEPVVVMPKANRDALGKLVLPMSV